MQIIGVSGHLGAGKDVVASYLVSNYNYTQISLADPLKRFCKRVFGFTEEQLWGPSEARNTTDTRFFSADEWIVTKYTMLSYAPEFCSDLGVVYNSRLNDSLLHHLEVLEHNYQYCLSPRNVLQTMGTEAFRAGFKQDIWVDQFIKISTQVLDPMQMVEYNKATGVTPVDRRSETAGVVVSDIRFANELQAIKGSKGHLIKIERPATDNKAYNTGVAFHTSETEQDNFDLSIFDFYIRNDKGLEDLKSLIDRFMFTSGIQA